MILNVWIFFSTHSEPWKKLAIDIFEILRKLFIFLSVIIQYLDILFQIDFYDLVLNREIYYIKIFNITLYRFMLTKSSNCQLLQLSFGCFSSNIATYSTIFPTFLINITFLELQGIFILRHFWAIRHYLKLILYNGLRKKHKKSIQNLPIQKLFL